MKTRRERPLIAFFDYPDVFEDFYPHYGVDQWTFATRWATTGSHAFLALLQQEIGDVIWYAFSLAPELSEARHEVLGCRVRILPSSWLHRCLWRSFYLPKHAWRWRCLYPAYATLASYISLLSWPFFQVLQHDNPDVFFVTDYATGRFDVLHALARALGVPLIARHAGSVPEHYLGRLAKRWTIPHTDRLIVSSRDELEMLASRYRVARERLMVILTPIDTNTFRPMDRTVACRAAGLDPARRYLLFMGRLDDPVKRVSVLIRSFASLADKHKDADLVVVGAGPDGEMLRPLAAECAPGRVRFLGWISGVEEKARIYNAAECLVLNSRKEGFPRVIAEAMACGTPVLAPRVGGIDGLVTEGHTGWLFAAGDGAALTAGISCVLTHPEVLTSIRPQARCAAESHVSPAVVVAALRKCFFIEGGQHR